MFTFSIDIGLHVPGSSGSETESEREGAGLGGVTEQKSRGLKEFVKSNKYGSVVFRCHRQMEWQKLRSSKSRKGSSDLILNKVKSEFKVSKLE